MKEIVLTIMETGREHLRCKPEEFNFIIEYFKTKEDLRNYLIERYGRMPKMRSKLYRDINSKSIVIGFSYSYWNQDVSHNSKKWYQTDRIVFFEEEKVITYFDLKS